MVVVNVAFTPKSELDYCLWVETASDQQMNTSSRAYVAADVVVRCCECRSKPPPPLVWTYFALCRIRPGCLPHVTGLPEAENPKYPACDYCLVAGDQGMGRGDAGHEGRWKMVLVVGCILLRITKVWELAK